MQTLNELKKKGQAVWIAAKPILKRAVESESFAHIVVWLVGGVFFFGLVWGISELWENSEAFRWLIGLGVVGVVLLVVADLAPLLIALAALVYLFNNC
jgi:hypothetical protein